VTAYLDHAATTPMVPEAVIAMLGCARVGAVHSVVFGGFAPAELAARINDARPKLIISASCGIEVDRVVRYKPLLDEAIEMANDTVYGLSATISGDPAEAAKVAPKLRAGLVTINAWAGGGGTPFGGYKQSGNGREFGKFGLEEFLEKKSVIGNLTAA